MRAEERDAAHLWDMCQAARDAARILGDLSLAQFLQSDRETTRLAIERKLEILGEAARRVSAGFRDGHPAIPWRELVGLRNVISHQYNKVDYEAIFRIVRQRMPNLITLLEPLLPPPPDEG